MRQTDSMTATKFEYWRPTVLTFALIVAFDFIVQIYFPSSNPLSFFSALLGSVVSVCFWGSLNVIQRALAPWVQWIVAALVSFFISGLLVVSFSTLSMLGDFINAYMLMFISVDRGFVGDQVLLYGFTAKSLGFLPLWALILWIWRPVKRREAGLWTSTQFFSRRRGWIWRKLKPAVLVVVFAVLLLVALNQLKYETVGQHKWADASLFLALKNFQKSTRSNVLRSSIRTRVPELKSGPRPDIVLFLGESWTRDYMKIYGWPVDAAPVMTEFFSGPQSSFLQNAISNSSCTDVSLPAIFSGVGPEESDEKLHQLPLVWDWLKAAGYETVFASPQKFAFANFDAFILSPGPDDYLSADRFMNLTQFMVAHNNGLDDIWAAKKTAERIAALPKDKPVLLVFFTNATHYPFLQTSSELKVQPKFEKKYENSLWLEDQAFDVLIKSFRENRDPKKLWVLTSNDHGEVENPTRTIPRIASFYEDTLAAPVMTRFPLEGGAVYENCRKGFERNRHVLAQNIDLLPTILDVVGFKDSAEHSALLGQLRGSSLCRPLDPNRIVIGLNTNNIRQWNPEGFLLAKNTSRLVFTNTEGLQFFDLASDPKQEHNRLNEMPLELRAEFRLVIEENPQLLRIKNLYLKEGL